MERRRLRLNSLLGTGSWDQTPNTAARAGGKHLLYHPPPPAAQNPAQIKDLQPPGVVVGASVALSLPTLTEPPRSGTCPGLSQQRGLCFPCRPSLLLHSPASHNTFLANLSEVGVGMEMDAWNGECADIFRLCRR